MYAAVEQHRAEIEALCREYGVTRLDVFGSVTRDDFDQKHSDVDFLVEFSYDTGRGALWDYFGLKEDLEALLGRSVDLASGEIENPFLLRSVETDREPLYAA